MITATKTHRSNVKSPDDGMRAIMARLFAETMRAFQECSDEVQLAIIEMSQIVNDPDADEDDKDLALATIQEALFPNHHSGNLGADLADLEQSCVEECPEMASAIAELDAEEAEFAERVQRLMAVQELTQSDLAEKSGVGQPAISMMLSRNCRPQKRTVDRLAKALGVSPQELWPSS